MSDLNVELLPWQQEVFADTTRFKIVAAGRRTGKSRLAAWMLIINALQTDKGHVFLRGTNTRSGERHHVADLVRVRSWCYHQLSH